MNPIQEPKKGGALLGGSSITQIETIPSGATVTIDGNVIGLTPVSFVMERPSNRSKAHDAMIELKDYNSIHGEVRQGDTFRLTMQADGHSLP